jgi:hypothetical protein
MNKIIWLTLLGAFFVGCGGGSSSPTIGPLSEDAPIDNIVDGFIDAQNYSILTTPADGLSPFCRGGRGVLFIQNNIISGTIIAGFSKPYVLFGTYIPETGEIDGGFKDLEQMVGEYSGKMNIDGGEGIWSDDFGCHGVWSAVKED